MPSNMFLKFERPEINGNCRVAGHENEIEVLGWNHGFVQQSVPELGKDAQEYATHTNLSFIKNIDSSTPELLKHCWSGKLIGRARLACYRAGAAGSGAPEEFLSVIMEHVVITSVSISTSSNDAPMENVTLDYGIISYEYKYPRNADGTYKSSMVKHNRETRVIV